MAGNDGGVSEWFRGSPSLRGECEEAKERLVHGVQMCHARLEGTIRGVPDGTRAEAGDCEKDRGTAERLESRVRYEGSGVRWQMVH